ncbi:MAG: acetolactate synthase [Phycisphaerales bacterium]|nr:acetolactate synthase [Phycisphaerales bacterium]
MESILPPETLDGAGFELTRVRQYTIFLENKVGRLQSLVRSLEQGVGKIVALSIEESGDTALVRLIAAHSEFGRELLRTAGFSFSETELLAVKLPTGARQPLVRICSVLLAAEINIHYAYPLLQSPKGSCMALYVDDPTLAAQLLIKKGFTLIGESDLQKW